MKVKAYFQSENLQVKNTCEDAKPPKKRTVCLNLQFLFALWDLTKATVFRY